MGFSFRNLGHYVAVVARDIVKVGSVVKQAEPVIEAVSAVVFPPAVVIERAAGGALGYLVDAASKIAPVADGQVTLTIQIAADELADFKAIAAAFKAHASTNGVVFTQKQ